MSFDIRKKFTRPENVLKENDYLYGVLNTVILIIIAGHSLAVPLFLSAGYVNLAIYSFLNIFLWIITWKLNQQGKHLLTTSIICVAIYLSAVIQILYLGWDAGLQYHLMAEMALLLLYPHKNLKASIIFSGLILVTFLFLYFYTLTIDYPKTTFIIQLYTFNSAISMLALAVTTLFFRTNTASLIDRLQVTASTDPLTGLYNRRRMNVELARNSKMLNRYEQTNTLILLDIDKFKHVNDKYGHGGGDEVLKQFSNLLKKGLRDTDIISRWGGEEFLVLMPFTEVKNAAIAAENLRKTVEAYPFKAAGQQAQITITCGVANLEAGKPIEEALKQVDKLLYEGKAKGRNRVMAQGQNS